MKPFGKLHNMAWIPFILIRSLTWIPIHQNYNTGSGYDRIRIRSPLINSGRREALDCLALCKIKISTVKVYWALSGNQQGRKKNIVFRSEFEGMRKF